MSNQMFKDIKFKNVDTNQEEFIRVYKPIDKNVLNKKIIEFLGSTNYFQDKSRSRIDVKELYSARPEDQPIIVQLVSSGSLGQHVVNINEQTTSQFRSANFLIKGKKQRLKFVFGNGSADDGEVWANGDRVLIRSKKPSANIITPSYLVNPNINLDDDDQPYLVELLPYNRIN